MNDATMDGKSAIRVAIGPKYEKGYHNKDLHEGFGNAHESRRQLEAGQ